MSVAAWGRGELGGGEDSRPAGWGGRRWCEESGWGRGLGPEPGSCLSGLLKWPVDWGTRDHRERVPASCSPQRIPSCLAADITEFSKSRAGPWQLLPAPHGCGVLIYSRYLGSGSAELTYNWCFLIQPRAGVRQGPLMEEVVPPSQLPQV